MISAVDGAQTTLYCVVEDADMMKSGAILLAIWSVQDEDAQERCGWPMKIRPHRT